jgi:hypothetical protein
MQFKSKKASLLILAITSIVLSRAMFWFFNDPEGPNLLIVMMMAVIIYVLSLGIYVYTSSIKGLTRLLLVIVVQIVIVSGLYFSLS